MSDTAASSPNKDTLRLHLQTLAVDLGKPPTVVDMHTHGDYHPQTYVDAYGSWDRALRAAGLDPDNIGKKITDLELLSELQRLDEKFGRPPKKIELAEHSKYSAQTYQDRFGSWNNALEEAMLETRTLSDYDLLQELRRLNDELGHPPRGSDMAEQGKYGQVTYYRRFGSWPKAIEEAGLEPSERQRRAAQSEATDDEAVDNSDASAPEIETAPNGVVVSPEAFARTYKSQSYADPWTAVEQYQFVTEYTAAHPNKGSAAVANALDLPRSRIRPWMEDDARPDCVRGIQAAESHDWLPLTIESDLFPAFNTLIAWILSGGSIDADRVVPSFVVDNDEGRVRVENALDDLGLGVRTVRKSDAGRSTELVPASDASVFGRMLTVLGAPQGEKNSGSELSLPPYLGAAPSWLRDEFVDVYLFNRGQTHTEKATITLHEDRNREYLEELAALVRQVSGGEVSVSGQNVVVSADAARNLYGKFGPQWG